MKTFELSLLLFGNEDLKIIFALKANKYVYLH